MTLLSLSSLSKKYGALVVTDAVSLDVGKGEILGILGPNGAGKTTLFNLIAGTVRPDAGNVQFEGADISALGASERCRMGISRSFQVPQPFNGMSVFENVLVGATFGREPKDPEARALAVLEQTGMKAKANTLAGGLTLLDRKRLELARALAANPKLLLLDEIAGGLTDSECAALLAAIKDVHASGVTIVWIEHVVHALLSVAQRLVVLNFGKLIVDGVPHEVMNSREVKSVYLGEDAHA
ncbi:ABC transporter ATP-binding protein [Aestuariivirga litoralis]|uniref:ABC transporter ATP-binding protein n=1 Tax=Aestuariivirga litoralis TaxID=2650924 RepID=UPI0018C5AA73|nr:ABC transporter ATP-binding protein [Aestuariivirga litoralis]MBG1233262.1 ABC transporter ATP-binding protein [Aestuariivirga litoralis]